jgi:hypothetical protein
MIGDDVADLISGSSKKDWKTLEHELIEVIEGLAVVLIGYGVALEERESFREMAGLIGKGHEVFEQALDKMAHHAGVWLVVLGLFSEVAIKLVEIPNTIVDTSLVERPLIMVAVAIQALTIGIMAHHCWRVLTIRKQAPG